MLINLTKNPHSAQPFPRKHHQYLEVLNFSTCIIPFELYKFPVFYFWLWNEQQYNHTGLRSTRKLTTKDLFPKILRINKSTDWYLKYCLLGICTCFNMSFSEFTTPIYAINNISAEDKYHRSHISEMLKNTMVYRNSKYVRRIHIQAYG